MLLWLGFSVVTAAVVAVLVRPLFKADIDGLDAAEADMAVYRDQMVEIAADRERGLIGDAEAEAARTEVARRLLAREQQAAGPASASGPASARPVEVAATQPYVLGRSLPRIAMVVAALVPFSAIGLYLKLGSPRLPAKPYEARMKGPADASNLDELLAKVETRLRAHPEDGQGWDVIAPVYMVHERHSDAANAFARAIAILGETPKRLAGLAEAHVMAADGVVDETARMAYERLRVLEPQRIEPRFWLALAKEQDGNHDAAAAEYRALLADAPADASWKPLVEARLKEVAELRQGGGGGGSVAGPGPRAGSSPAVASKAASKAANEAPAAGGPSAADVDAAAKMSPEQRVAMIGQMVDGLAAKLKTNGKDLAGWLKLVRAYSVMGRRSDAVAAVAEARRNLAGDEAALAEIAALEKSLGLGT